MACTLVPTYLSEVAPGNLRGQAGVLHQLFITIGILLAQMLGFKEILGTNELWHFLLAGPIVPALLGSTLLLFLFPETPKALILKNRDKKAARIALQILRNRVDVEDELAVIEQESSSNNNDGQQSSLSILLKSKELRWPLLIALLLNMAQQLSGVNAVITYFIFFAFDLSLI